MNVGIVGAGVLGLSAAKVLQDHAHTVTIFEGRPDVGGQVVTFEVGGARKLRCSPATFTRNDHELSVFGRSDKQRFEHAFLFD